MTTTRLKIAKLSGADDTAPIEKALEAIPRVTAVTIKAEDNEVLVDHEDADVGALTNAVKQQGYIASPE